MMNVHVVDSAIKRRQGGMVLMDSFMALGLVLAFLVISVGLYTLGAGRIASVSATANMTAIADGARNIYNRSRNFDGLDTSTAIQAGIVPKSMIAGNTIMSQWATPITIATTTLSSGAPAFSMQIDNVPKAECTQFVSNVETVFDRVEVGGTVVKDQGTEFNATGTATSCGAGTAGVTVLLVAGKR